MKKINKKKSKIKKKDFIEKKIKREKKIKKWETLRKKKIKINREENEEEKKIEILIPNKKLSIKEISEVLETNEEKIKKSIKILKIKDIDKIKPENIILISDYLNIITKINEDDFSKEINEIEGINEENKEGKISRNIIIGVIGEVDVGKTTLINQICGNKFKEKKNITQEINIYNVNIKKSEFIILDTPGHKDLEDFKNFSIKISDVIILVIDYKEINELKNINIIKEIERKKIPLILNINKIDLLDKKRDIEKEFIKYKIENEFNFIINITSSKFKIGINELTEKIYNIKNIKNEINIKKEFEGIIIENSINNDLKILTTIFIKQGNIKNKDIIISGENYGKIEKIFNNKNKEIKESKENNIVKIICFKKNPDINDTLKTIHNEKLAKIICKFRKYKHRMLNSQNKNLNQKEILNKCKQPDTEPSLNLIIMAKSARLLESIKNSILNTKFNLFKINFIKLTTNELSISDIKLAKTTKSKIIVFNSVIKNNIINYTKKNKININQYNNIYEVLEYIKNINYNKILFESENILGIVVITKIFNILNKTIIGCVVIQGKAKIKSQIKIFRNEKEIYRGTIESLKLLKNDVIEVKKGLECGIFIKNFNNYLINDKIIFYKI